jgi:hypothetical protein
VGMSIYKEIDGYGGGKIVKTGRKELGTRSLMELPAMVGSLSIRDNNSRVTG